MTNEKVETRINEIINTQNPTEENIREAESLLQEKLVQDLQAARQAEFKALIDEANEWVSDDQMPADAEKMRPADRRVLRGKIRALLKLRQRGRETVLVGVTDVIPFNDGTPNGSLHLQNSYRLPYHVYEALRLDHARSHKVCLLEPQYPNMRFEVRGALRIMFPNVYGGVYGNDN